MLVPPHLWQQGTKMPKSLFTTGKRPGQSLVAACDIGQPRSRLFFIGDRISGLRFLVDTGAEISVLPPSSVDRRQKQLGSPLQAANGSVINTFGLCSLTLDIGLRRTFRWVFTIAAVSHPILGSDFLSFFNLNVSVRNRRLSDEVTTLAVNGIASRTRPLGIRALLPTSDYERLLSDFPAITRPCSLAATVQHDVTHRIDTTGSPCFRKTSSTCR